LPLAHFSKLYAVDDCKIAKLTADPAGGSPSYGSILDVPGIKTATISGTVDTKELRGDNQLLDKNSTLKSIQVAVQHAKLSLDVLAILQGGAVVDAGTTPNQTATYTLLGTDTMNYFKLEARTPANGADFIGGDVHFVLHKLIISALPDIGLTEEDYRIVSFTADASPLISTSKFLTIVENETAAAIS